MSAYGPIKRSDASTTSTLPNKLWSAPSKSDPDAYVTTHHLTLATARRIEGLVEHLNTVFAEEVASGLTYPQEGDVDHSAFEGYFFAADVLVGITGGMPRADREGGEIDLDIDVARAGRTWEECVAGFYYSFNWIDWHRSNQITPDGLRMYVLQSDSKVPRVNKTTKTPQICNAGFVVSPTHRGKGYGSVLARSYVDYAPRLGYQASVFNLVYANNIASIKLWERLNFTKAGLIPRAGRLKRKDGNGEEYVDAIVFYKSFLE
ncbi:L-azetidine-2-carboxylic acid acetyltransferase [Hypsizygus marmoreus]|uniref:L-azetidine-2-carboxylic acid acetyltransferase n=1 Tax=Hypsizygus marmoreus TaxID=39966 RepID=A0A369JRD2_HYPMA|nr:L-azetidine-2-carboxylic acid acetyltransferase [Hypsizygus marmoreus]